MFGLENTLYSLKQDLRVYYERLSSFFVNKNFVKGKVDTILFNKHVDSGILIIQIYIDDIIFRSTNEKLCKEFALYMK